MDLFVFNELTDGEHDEIEDFEVGVDHIHLSGVAGNGRQAKFDVLEFTDGPTFGNFQIVTVENGGHAIVVKIGVPGEVTIDDFIFV